MERLYQYLWKSGIAGKKFKLTDGRRLDVLDPGRLNNDAGPDFFNAKLLIDGTEWVGNVEIHVKASDWLRHGHDKDKAYDSVVLHVVAVNDYNPTRPDGQRIPQLELVMSQAFYATYATLEQDIKALRCERYLDRLSPITVTDWLESLAVERLQSKASRVEKTYELTGNDWDQTLFVTLARAFGFGLNGDPFEITARSLPLKYVYRHGDSLLQIEALLFGQAGMLDPSLYPYDIYYQNLCREYLFLGRKYGLSPIPPGMWKYSRSRPQNFPHRRLAFLAALLMRGLPSIKRLSELCNDPEALAPQLSAGLSGYWATRYSFGAPECSAPTNLSRGSLQLLMINAVAPVVYSYGWNRGETELTEKALDLLYLLPGEKNSIIRQWENAGLKSGSALRSQALLHLRSDYCDARKCLYCRFAYQLLHGEVKGSISRTLFDPIENRDVLVAMDSFKECLSSREAGLNVASGVREALSAYGISGDIKVMTMADGGEGMTEAIADAISGKWMVSKVMGPDGMMTTGIWYMTDDHTAYIEMAAAAGLMLVAAEQRDPMNATTYGVGMMIADALKQNVKRIIIGLGGSATTDAGLGALQALGFRLLDKYGDEMKAPAGGADMERLGRIEYPEGEMNQLIKNCRFELGCDVDAPMNGPQGAAFVFAPQKGASPGQVARLDLGLKNVARCLKELSAGFNADLPGGGAAGACGATFATLLEAEIKSGADITLDAQANASNDPEGFYAGFDIMVTGEGASDRQTLMGKVPAKVLERMDGDCHSLLLAGKISDRELFLKEGFNDARSINSEEIEKECCPGEDPLNPKVAADRLKVAAAQAIKEKLFADSRNLINFAG